VPLKAQLVFAESLSTDPKEREEFERTVLPTTVHAWVCEEKPDGRIVTRTSRQKGSMPAHDLREALKAAAKMPYIHRGGRPYKELGKQLGELWKELGRLRCRMSRSAAIQRIAQREGVDPRTLRTAFKRAGYEQKR
jgi:hypothetical protein